MSSSIPYQPLLKLISLLILLPWTITYLHLHYYTFWQHEYCLVGPPSSSFKYTTTDNNIRGEDDVSTNNGMYGLYAPIPQKKNNLDRRVFRQKYSIMKSVDDAAIHTLSSGWPSLTQVALAISTPSSALSKYSDFNEKRDASAILNTRHEIVFVESNNVKMWCLQSGNDKWCSDPLNNNAKKTIYLYPPSGTWLHSTNESKPPLTLSCPTPAMTSPPNKKSKHQKQNGRQNQNVQFLLHHPTTTLLLLLNIGLAYQYWNHRISPSAVCKSYNKICVEHEWWRSFTGATAHFEPLHIGFNMMSLHTLGKELEGGFGSVIFLVYNIALVVMCTVVMMGMVYGRLCWVKYQGGGEDMERRLKETSSVGYSGVLFALMVITTLERNQATCPIPFFSDVCFATHSVPGFPWLKFNIAPIVSLFVAQFIMPRVSFMGHLAGIACGFGLHWGWGFPPLEVCSPNVMISMMYLVGCLIISRKIIPVRPLSDHSIDEDDLELHLESGGQNGDTSCVDDDTLTDPIMRGKQRKRARETEEVLRKQRTLELIRNLIAMIAFASMILFDLTSSLVLSQFILLGYVAFATQAYVIVLAYTHVNKAENDLIELEKNRAGVIWKGCVVAATLSIVVDSMTMASWIVLRTFIATERSPILGLPLACGFMFIRIAMNGIVLVAASRVLHDVSQVGSGIFTQIFWWVLSSSKKIGDELFLSQAPLWSAFEGRGIRLGSRARVTL